jgi:hexulose-6-phosphate isomerase
VLNVGTSQVDCEKIRGQVEASGLVFETTAAGLTWGANPCSDDKSVRENSLKMHEAALQRASWLGAKAMLYVPGVVAGPIGNEIVRYDKAVERAREAAKRLTETAEKVGVDLCAENVWNGLFYSPLEFIDFVDSIGSDRFGMYFDVGNTLGYHQHTPHWIELLGQRIKRVHIKDYKLNFNWMGAFSFCNLLEGEVPWAQTMAALKESGYDGTLVAEMMPHDPGLLARTSAAMDKIMAM